MFGNAQSMSSAVVIIVSTLRFEFYGAEATRAAYKGAGMTTISLIVEKEGESMFRTFSTAAFASTLLLTVAVSGWAAEEKKAPPAKAEKMGEMEKKPADMGKMEKKPADMGMMEKKPADMGMMPTGSEETRKVQEALKAKGNDPGPIDGRMGPKTRAAVKAFQEANGMKGTGQVDAQTAEKIGVQKRDTAMGKETKAIKKEGTEPMSKPPMSKEPMKEPMSKPPMSKEPMKEPMSKPPMSKEPMKEPMSKEKK